MNRHVDMEKNRFRKIFIQKIKDFYDNERNLLDDDLGERALVFRIGGRLYNAFDKCSVHCEYNKAHRADETTSKSIPGKIHTYPDLIIVSDIEKGSDANKIVVEVKKAGNRNDFKNDIDKLHWFTDPTYRYRYDTGYHLVLGKSFFILCHYENGKLFFVEKYEKPSWKSSRVENIEYSNAKELINAFHE